MADPAKNLVEATEPQPKSVPVATAVGQSTAHQCSTHGDGRFGGGRPSGSPPRGSGFLLRGNTTGNGAANRCAGLASVGGIRGEPTTRPAHFSRPGADPARNPSGSQQGLIAVPGKASGLQRSATGKPANLTRGAPCKAPEGPKLVNRVTNTRFTWGFARRPIVPISLQLPVSPVQLRADARRPHLGAGHRGRSRHPTAPPHPAGA